MELFLLGCVFFIAYIIILALVTISWKYDDWKNKKKREKLNEKNQMD